ncbi:MAG: SGNH/GDSL hydrolase family protein [Candidatus Omnitrophota bacterium]
MRVKKIISNLAIALATLFVIALVAEAGFRIRDLFNKNRGLKACMGEVNRKYHYSFKPNRRSRMVASKNNEFDVAVRINNYGFRGGDIDKNKRLGVPRVMVIGDSFTFGVGAEEDETIPFLIEKYLADEGKRTEVINAGFGSYSPLLHYLRVRDEFLQFKPDIVLYLFDFSDLADDWRYEKSLVYDASGNIIRCDPAFVDGKRDWWKIMRMHSRLCVYIHNKVIRLIDKIRILGLKNYIKAKMEGKRSKVLIVTKKPEEGKFKSIKYDVHFMIRGRDRLPQITEHFKRTEKYLNLLKGALTERGIPMMLVIFPRGIQVGPYQWAEGRKSWGFKEGVTYDDYYAFDLLEDYAKRNNIPCINVLPALLENNDKELFFPIDGHFTPEANKITAEAIVKDKAFREALEYDIIKEGQLKAM